MVVFALSCSNQLPYRKQNQRHRTQQHTHHQQNGGHQRHGRGPHTGSESDVKSHENGHDTDNANCDCGDSKIQNGPLNGG